MICMVVLYRLYRVREYTARSVHVLHASHFTSHHACWTHPSGFGRPSLAPWDPQYLRPKITKSARRFDYEKWNSNKRLRKYLCVWSTTICIPTQMAASRVFPNEIVLRVLKHSTPRDIVRWRTVSLLFWAKLQAHSSAGFKVVLCYNLRCLDLERSVHEFDSVSSTWTVSISVSR